MPNIKSAKKRVKVIETKTMRNKIEKTILKTAVKKYEAALAGGEKAVAEDAFRTVCKKLDKAAAHGIISKNKAARKKSRFQLKLNKLGA
jgi:small subunit ribosomal protein S20